MYFYSRLADDINTTNDLQYVVKQFLDWKRLSSIMKYDLEF